MEAEKEPQAPFQRDSNFYGTFLGAHLTPLKINVFSKHLESFVLALPLIPCSKRENFKKWSQFYHLFYKFKVFESNPSAGYISLQD